MRIFLLLAACSYLSIDVVAPRPTISLASSTERLAMVLPAGVPDRFDIEYYAKIRVSGFRTSLQNGFAAAFQRYFPLVHDGADLTLRFEQVALELRPKLTLRYAVVLDDRQGHALGRSFATLTGREVTGSEDESFAELLTRMYEKIAEDCFVRRSS